MAKRVKFHTKPHINADGTESKTKKDYWITLKLRGKARARVMKATSRKAAEEAVEEVKEKVFS